MAGGREWVTSSWFVVAAAWRHARVPFLYLVLCNAVQAVVPAVQVLVTAGLLGVADQGIGQSWPWLVALVALVGATQLLGELQHVSWSFTGLRLHRWYQGALVDAVAGFAPLDLSDPVIAGRVQVVRSKLLELGDLVGAILNIFTAVVTAAALGIALWQFSPVGAVLAVVALVPGVAISMWAARVWAQTFEAQGPAARRAEYAAEQLVSQRTATELSTLGSSAVVADIAAREGRSADSPVRRLLDRLLVGQVGAGLGSAAVLGPCWWRSCWDAQGTWVWPQVSWAW